MHERLVAGSTPVGWDCLGDANAKPSQGWVRDREHNLHVNWLEVAIHFIRGVEVDAHADGMTGTAARFRRYQFSRT